jgi:hypothetical protein
MQETKESPSARSAEYCRNSTEPLTYAWQDDDLDSEGKEFMEFRLVYEGPLKAQTAGNSRVADKHAIRKQFHGQLEQLWERHPSLHNRKHDKAKSYDLKLRDSMPETFFAYPGSTDVETFAQIFSRCGFGFVPLVSKQYRLICGLNILFLRRENPGDLILRGGDIDNRIKTLLDALRVPENGSELPANATPEAHETPFYCLLENDSLVTELNVTTDRLLKPLSAGQNPSEVMLIVQVKIKGADIGFHNLELLG